MIIIQLKIHHIPSKKRGYPLTFNRNKSHDFLLYSFYTEDEQIKKTKTSQS